MSGKPTPWMAKLSHLEKPISAFGLLLLVAVVGYGYRQLAYLREQVHQRANDKAGLDRSIEDLRSEIRRLKTAPVRELVTPRAIAVPLRHKRDAQDRPLYNFMLWVELPASRRNDIAKVEYRFDHPSYLVKTRTGTDPSNSFAISYLGWGCLQHVSETIVDPQGRQYLPPIDFEMCKALGW